MAWCRQATSHYLSQCCIWFHSAVASICNVNATGINPNNMIKFYDAIYMASSWSMSERDVLYWNPQNCVTCRMPMQTSQQNQLRFRTSSTAGSTADWLLTWHTHRPDIKNGFFSILTVHLEILHKGRPQCSLQNKFQTNWAMAKKLWRNSAERMWYFSSG